MEIDWVHQFLHVYENLPLPSFMFRVQNEYVALLYLPAPQQITYNLTGEKFNTENRGQHSHVEYSARITQPGGTSQGQVYLFGWGQRKSYSKLERKKHLPS